MDTRYPSKVDLWLGAVLVGVVALTLCVGVMGYREEGYLALLPLALVAAIFGGLVLPVEYVMEADRLVVRSGLIRYRIPYDKIQSARLTRNPLSSPALSIDRIDIRYGRFGVLISPPDREAFLQDLSGRCPHLRFDDGNLVRRDRWDL